MDELRAFLQFVRTVLSPPVNEAELPSLSRSPSLSSMTSQTSPPPSPAPSSQRLIVSANLQAANLQSPPPPPGENSLAAFDSALSRALIERMTGHWHTDCPERGSAYRSLCIINGKPDSTLAAAADLAGIHNFAWYFPPNIVFWIDPGHVSCRIGDAGYPISIWVNESVSQLPIPPSPSPLPTKMSLAAILPPFPPNLSKQQLRHLKIQQKQLELQEMARSLSQQYSIYTPYYPTCSSSPSPSSSSSGSSPSSSPLPAIPSPPSMGRFKSAPTNLYSLSKKASHSLYNNSNINTDNSDDNNNKSSNDEISNSSSNSGSSTSSNSRRSRSKLGRAMASQQQQPQHQNHMIPGLLYKDTTPLQVSGAKMSRGGSRRPKKHYLSAGSNAPSAVC